jgi:hypothetical protein
VKWDDTIKITDVAIVIAAIVGPVLAVQAQVFLEKRRELRQRRSMIFHTLMRTRAANLSPDHVQALNSIPIEFYGVPKITDVFKSYISHLNLNPTTTQGWADRRIDLLMDLLHKIAIKVGYKFDVAQLKSEFYSPVGHQTLENEQTSIRQGLARILSGQGAFPMEVTKFPGDPEAQAAFKAVVKGETAIKVKQAE